MKKTLTKAQQLKADKDYIAFLEKRLASKNFRANVTQEEFDKTKAKLDKARLKMKLLNN